MATEIAIGTVIGGVVFLLLGLGLAIIGRNGMSNDRFAKNTVEKSKNLILFGPVARLTGWVTIFFGSVILLVGLAVLASS